MSSLQAALSHHHAGRLSEAESIYRGILSAEPENADVLHLLGMLERQSKRPSAAAELIRRAIDLNGNVPDFYNNLGAVLLDTGEIDEAVKAFMRALHLRPRYPEAAFNLANTLARTGKAEEAANFYRAVLAFDPGNADAANNLGVMLSQLGRFEEAVESYQQATRLQPGHADAHYNCGNARLALGRVGEAVGSYEAVVAARPNHPEPHYNLGKALQSLGRHDDALRCFEEALALAPEHGDIHYSRALLLLLMGRHKEGWAEHEWRWRATGFTGHRRGFAQPLWDGGEKPGATLLLHAEQGLGDAIQFARYASFARARVGRVVLEVPRPLIALMGNLPGVDELVARGDALPDFEIQAPLLTLPHVLGEAIGAPIQYLAADPERVQRWAGRLGEKGPRVGLVWAGNPRHANDRNRSLQAAMLRPLIEQGQASFFCLQPAPRFADLAAAGLGDHVTDLSAELTDLAETAAALSALDLLITVDTAVAHLAGALGRPVWLMLPFIPDWRWGLGGTDTSWYPQMRLFRQDRAGDWEPVIMRLLETLNRT